MANEVKQDNKIDEVYFTQKELAQRWRVTEATVKSIRDRGDIPYFFPPNSSRVLYPVEQIIQIENDLLNYNIKEGRKSRKLPETKVKKPVNPAKSGKEWRI